VFRLLSAAALIALGAYLTYQDWILSPTFAFQATNGKFLVAVPAVVLLSAIPALLWAWIRRHPKYLTMPTEAAPATALD
jgi:hypothetical protein